MEAACKEADTPQARVLRRADAKSEKLSAERWRVCGAQRGSAQCACERSAAGSAEASRKERARASMRGVRDEREGAIYAYNGRGAFCLFSFFPLPRHAAASPALRFTAKPKCRLIGGDSTCLINVAAACFRRDARSATPPRPSARRVFARYLLIAQEPPPRKCRAGSHVPVSTIWRYAAQRGVGVPRQRARRP